MKKNKKSNVLLKTKSKSKRNFLIKRDNYKKFKREMELGTKFNIFIIIKIFFIFILFVSFIHFLFKSKSKYKKFDTNFLDKNNNAYSLYEKYKNLNLENTTCNILDPIKVFEERLKNTPIEICNEKNTKHICYTNKPGYYSDILLNKNGTICYSENIVIDPSKGKLSGLIYKGPVDKNNFGYPLLSKGFFNTKCKQNKVDFEFNKYCKFYENAWNYDYDIEKENEILEELAPNKTVLLLSRSQDSPNLFHGNCEIINVISVLYLFNLPPEQVRVLFLESIEIPQDPFLDLYKNMISKGGEPIHFKNLTKKYKISKAIHVPLSGDSSPYIYIDVPKCNTSTITYQLYNDLVDKYMDLKPFQDLFISDNKDIYYPESIINNNKNGIKFIKIVTIQWRKVWPEGRRGQGRILNNGQQLADKLTKVLPNNILVRLINTAALPYKDQISVMRNTDYLIGIHGAGLALSIFLPHTAIYHEILHGKNIPVLSLMSSLSGHITYSDILKATTNFNDGNENVSFDENAFAESVLLHMKENKFFN